MKVLMATDGSKDAAVAINTARRLLRNDDLEVDVLSVSPEFAFAGASRKIAQNAQETLIMRGIHANALIEAGSPQEDILRAASDYDLVVVGAHGKSERTQPGLGPVSDEIVQHARTSVLVGRPLTGETAIRVLVALDGSDESFAALGALATFFEPSTMDVTLMHVLEMPWTTLENVDPLESDSSSTAGELRDEADRMVNRGLQQLEEWSVPTSIVIEEGDPALEIASHAEEGGYDLIVMGATGSAQSESSLLGSVSLKLAWNAPCSVLIVRT